MIDKKITGAMHNDNIDLFMRRRDFGAAHRGPACGLDSADENSLQHDGSKYDISSGNVVVPNLAEKAGQSASR